MPKALNFSQRKGFKPIKDTIQVYAMDGDTRVSLWNALELGLWSQLHLLIDPPASPKVQTFARVVWWRVFQQPLDTCPTDRKLIYNEIRHYFFACEWHEVYSFLEVLLGFFENETLNRLVNRVLESELAGYRYVGGVFTDITSAQEIEMLNDALADSDFPGVRAHLQRALELLSDRKNPDYRNSMKESISAVEGLARAMTGNPKATLGDALKQVEISGKIHPALKEAFTKLYGYTSDEGGIRHAMEDEPNLTAADARYFLLSCSSFINYLKAKISTEV